MRPARLARRAHPAAAPRRRPAAGRRRPRDRRSRRHAFARARGASPSSTAKAYTVPSKVDVKTTSFDTVAQPKFGDGRRRSHSVRPVPASSATSRPRPCVGSSSSAPGGRSRCPSRRDRRPERTAGRPHRPSASRPRRAGPGTRSPGAAAADRRRFGAARRRAPAPSPRLAVPRDHASGLAGAEHEVDPVDRREDRRRLEVVVPTSCGVTWSCQSRRPVRASSTSSESVYSTGPGKSPPFGRSGVPPQGAGFELPA